MSLTEAQKAQKSGGESASTETSRTSNPVKGLGSDEDSDLSKDTPSEKSLVEGVKQHVKEGH
jgi:hypothetical protein